MMFKQWNYKKTLLALTGASVFILGIVQNEALLMAIGIATALLSLLNFSGKKSCCK